MSHIKAQSIIDVDKVPALQKDMELLSQIMIEELEAVNLYEQMMYSTDNKKVKELLEELRKEEKEHFEKARKVLILISPEEKDEDED